MPRRHNVRCAGKTEHAPWQGSANALPGIHQHSLLGTQQGHAPRDTHHTPPQVMTDQELERELDSLRWETNLTVSPALAEAYADCDE